jgi:hypothetical protein
MISYVMQVIGAAIPAKVPGGPARTAFVAGTSGLPGQGRSSLLARDSGGRLSIRRPPRRPVPADKTGSGQEPGWAAAKATGACR